MRQSLQEAREHAESTYTLRADVLRELLEHCTSVRTVRLCLHVGDELALARSAKPAGAALRTGSDKPWFSRPAEGLLVLK